MLDGLFRWFEQRVDPYPQDRLNEPLPSTFFAFVWQATNGLRLYIALLVLLTAGAAAFEVILYSSIGHLVDWVSHTTPQSFLQRHGQDLWGLVAVLAITIFCASGQSILKHLVLYSNFPMRLRWRFHNLLMGQSLDFFHQDFAGRLSAKVMQTSLAVREFCMILADMLTYVVIYFVSINIILGSISPWLMLPLGIWLLLFILTASFFIPRLGSASHRQANARAVMTGRITDAYTNIQTVKLFAHAGRENIYARQAMQEFMQTVYQQMRLGAMYQISVKLLSAFLYISMIGMALWLWLQGQAALGVIAATTAMVLKLDSMAEFLMWNITSLFESVGTIQDGMSSMGKPILVVDKPNARELEVTAGAIEFRKVTFGYGEQPVLRDFDLSIRPGEKIGIVGRSGAGKSTLIQLLLRFYDVQDGQIRIDGQNIAEVTQDSLRRNIALVTQDTSLLHRSVSENILYGRPDATNHDVTQAIAHAQADQFIPQLIDNRGRTGLDAMVGERGVKLSGGQRQRIAIARVFLKDSPILVLDEATSALDSEVEAAIQNSLERLMEGKTVIAIAHRLSTISRMDRLIVMDQGRIIEQGTHQHLIEQGGLYAQLWARQSGGFLAE